jgi:NarL family two-component system response regulator LiaR
LTQQNNIRVMIVDDHDIVRHGLTLFLQAVDDFTLVGEAKTGLDAFRKIGEFRPDVILMDLMMPEMDGIEATRRIKEAEPTIQIIALTSSKDDVLVQRALTVGATGYLMKNVSLEDLATAIREAYQGNPTLSPEATRALISASTRPAQPQFNLTERELDVLKLMVQGMSNPQIAERLVVSRSTVKFHISSILSKMGVASRTEAVAIALQSHLVS